MTNSTHYFVLPFDVTSGVAEGTALVAMATALASMTSETWTIEAMDRTRLRQSLVTRTILRVMTVSAGQKISLPLVFLTIGQGFSTGECGVRTQTDQERLSPGVPTPNPSKLRRDSDLTIGTLCLTQSPRDSEGTTHPSEGRRTFQRTRPITLETVTRRRAGGSGQGLGLLLDRRSRGQDDEGKKTNSTESSAIERWHQCEQGDIDILLATFFLGPSHISVS